MAADRVSGMDERQLRTFLSKARDFYSACGSSSRFFCHRTANVAMSSQAVPSPHTCGPLLALQNPGFKEFGSYHWHTAGSESEATSVLATSQWLAMSMLSPFDCGSAKLCEYGESKLDRLPILDVERAISAGAAPDDPSYRGRVLSDVAKQKEFGLVDVHSNAKELSATIWVAGIRDRGEVRDAIRAITGRNEFGEVDLIMYTGTCVIAGALVTG